MLKHNKAAMKIHKNFLRACACALAAAMTIGLCSPFTAFAKNSKNGGANETFNTATAQLVKADNYNTPSMSGATMKNDAELLRDSEGRVKLVLHFAPAVINGILAYATDLKVDDAESEFILKTDNSALCIMSYESLSGTKVSKGHIWSSVMDADVALKISDIKKVSDVSSKLSEKVKEAKKLLKDNEYYESSANKLKKAIEDANKSDNNIEAYVNIEKAIAGLVEKKADPFVGDSIFHLKAIDTSVAGSKSLDKYVRVTVDNKGNKILTAKYNAYFDWSGEVYFKDVQVLDKDGKAIEVEYKLDDDHNGVLKFKMPEIPASGIFKTVLTEGDGRINNSDLKLDYTTIKKGVFKELLQEAIDEYTSYEKDDWSGKGNIEEKKDDFTASSWQNFTKVVDKCNADLKKSISQDTVDKDIVELKKARLALVYKAKAGQGNTANTGISGFNNPNNYYTDGVYEKPVKVGWAGSKLVFGGKIYKVLNKGNAGKVLIMSDATTVKKKFSDEEFDSINEAVRWDASILREYLNNEFYNSFNDIEKSIILETELKTYDARDAGFDGIMTDKDSKCVVTNDRIFAPDLDMMQNSEYGFASKDGRDEGIYYATRMIMEDALGDVVVVGVKPKGRIEGVFMLSSAKLETLPCMNIDAGKILLTLDKNTSFAQFKEVKKTENNLWKIVIADEEISAPKASFDGGKVQIEGSSGNVYAAIVSGESFLNGELKYFGKVNSEFTLSEAQKSAGKLYLLSVLDDGNTARASQPVLVKENGTEPENPGGGDEPHNPNSRSMQINARLEASGSECFVTIPSTISVGELSSTNLSNSYKVKVELAEGAEVTVDSEQDGEITSGKNKLNFTNDFGSRTFTSNEEVEANIVFDEHEVKKAKPGSYLGITTFNITVK